MGNSIESLSGSSGGCGMAVKVGMASEQGPRRSNDDFCAISYESDFFAVSDGIGGAPRGDVFSKIACNAAVDAFERWGDICRAFKYANDVASTTSRYLKENSGATLLLACRREGTMEFAWAGDSVALRLRGGTLEMVTDPGRMPGGGNELSKAVAYGPICPDRTEVDVRPGDRYVLCTDGVWEYVSDDDMARILSDGDNAPLIADRLCRHAAGVGQDNCTCIFLIFEEAAQGEDGLRRRRAPLGQPASTPLMMTDRED